MCEPTLNLSLALHYSLADGVTVVYNKIYSDNPPVSNPLYSEAEILAEFDKMLQENSHLFQGQKTTRISSQQLVYTITFIKPVILPLHNMKRINGKIIIVSTNMVLLVIKTKKPVSSINSSSSLCNPTSALAQNLFFRLNRLNPFYYVLCILFIGIIIFFYLIK
nr:ORF56 [Acipenserid herpesvirus 1]